MSIPPLPLLSPERTSQGIARENGLLLEGPSPVLVCGSVTSALDIAAQCDPLPVWGSVLAESQTQGRGQLGRSWDSPPGNLYAALRLPEEAPMNGDAAAPAIGGMLAMILSEFGISIHVKWPNDLVLTLPKLNTFCKKVGGILLEEKNGRLLMGLGLNIASAPDNSLLREKTALAAGCIPAAVVQSVQITCLADLWLHIVNALRQLMEDGIARNWRYLAEARLLGRGELADVCDGPDEAPVVHGRILGLDDSGGIRINTELGVRTCTSGSLRLYRREEEL